MLVVVEGLMAVVVVGGEGEVPVVGSGVEVHVTEVGVGSGVKVRDGLSTAERLTHKGSLWEELNFGQSKCSGQVRFLSRRKSSQPALALSHVSRQGVTMKLVGKPG